MKIFHTATIAFGLLFTSLPANAAIVEYSAGHGDIGLAFHDGELELHYHFGDGAVLDGTPLVGDIEYEPGEAYVRLSDSTRTITTANVAFLGTTVGEPVWLLPQGNIAGLPFLGIAAEELDNTVFSNATLSLTSVSGPGEFALWQPGGLGGVNVFWQSNNGFDGTDILTLAIGDHDHFNYGFTQEGVYELGITATANLIAGGSLTDVETFRFVVGSATAVPEPGSLAVLGIGGGWMAWRRRRRNAQVPVSDPA